MGSNPNVSADKHRLHGTTPVIQGVVYKNFAGLGWSYLYRLILAYLLYHKLHIITEDDSSNILLILSVHYGQTNTKWREVLKLVETLNIRC